MVVIKTKQLGYNYCEGMYNGLYGYDIALFYGVDGKYRNISGLVVAELITNKQCSL